MNTFPYVMESLAKGVLVYSLNCPFSFCSRFCANMRSFNALRDFWPLRRVLVWKDAMSCAIDVAKHTKWGLAAVITGQPL